MIVYHYVLPAIYCVFVGHLCHVQDNMIISVVSSCCFILKFYYCDRKRAALEKCVLEIGLLTWCHREFASIYTQYATVNIESLSLGVLL